MFRIRSFFKELEPTRQMSEAFRNCIFLALSGGFQDAYTYFTRDGVFANAQTGNVVLMSTNFMTGKWGEGLKYLFPILAFALGVLVADLIQKKFKYFKKIHWRQGILLFEIIILFAVGFMPKSMDTVAAVIVSFSCAMQVQTFRKVRGYSYASTMCILVCLQQNRIYQFSYSAEGYLTGIVENIDNREYSSTSLTYENGDITSISSKMNGLRKQVHL